MTKEEANLNEMATMQLEDFVTETLTQIIKGVIATQNNIKDTSALINPVGSYVFKDNRGEQIDINFQPVHQIVEFDVAVTATSGDKAKGGVGVFIGGVGLGMQAQTNIVNSTVSRIKFTIPIYLPQEYDEKTENVPKQEKKMQHPAKNLPL